MASVSSLLICTVCVLCVRMMHVGVKLGAFVKPAVQRGVGLQRRCCTVCGFMRSHVAGGVERASW